MSIPGDPSVQDVILNGMKEGGQYTITAGGTAYNEFKDYQFATVKTELWNACKTDKLLEVETVLLASTGNSTLSLPTDFDSEVKLVVYDADDSYRGTAQSGAASSITLASTFSATTEEMYGRLIFTLSGSGSSQVRQVVNYNDTTKVATIHEDWTTQPDATTGYMVATNDYELRRCDYVRGVTGNARPSQYNRTGLKLYVLPPSDKIYPILVTYRSNLTRLDDASSTFVKHMRERRHLWVQGVKVRTMARYDDDRYPAEKQIWDQMLAQYAAENVVYTRLVPYR